MVISVVLAFVNMSHAPVVYIAPLLTFVNLALAKCRRQFRDFWFGKSVSQPFNFAIYSLVHFILKIISILDKTTFIKL